MPGCRLMASEKVLTRGVATWPSPAVSGTCSTRLRVMSCVWASMRRWAAAERSRCTLRAPAAPASRRNAASRAGWLRHPCRRSCGGARCSVSWVMTAGPPVLHLRAAASRHSRVDLPTSSRSVCAMAAKNPNRMHSGPVGRRSRGSGPASISRNGGVCGQVICRRREFGCVSPLPRHLVQRQAPGSAGLDPASRRSPPRAGPRGRMVRGYRGSVAFVGGEVWQFGGQ